MKTIALLAGIAATLGVSVGGSTWGTGGTAYTTSSGVGWYYSAEERAFFSTPAAFAGPTEPSFEYAYAPTCQGNGPGSSSACAAALCTASSGAPGVTYWQFARPVTPPGSPWTLQATLCIPGERRVDLADVEAQVRAIIEAKFREVAAPTVQMAPQGSGLVNLPLLAWTDDPGDFRLEIEQPLPGVITGTPQFSWAWSNGASSQGPGRPYSAQTSPITDPGAYVSATYAHRGQASVTLTVTWRGQVTVPGVQPVDIEPLVYTSSASLPVVEARSVLVEGS